MSLFFFLNDTATTEIYTLSLHDALPIFKGGYSKDSVEAAYLELDDEGMIHASKLNGAIVFGLQSHHAMIFVGKNSFLRLRSEEHTSELQSRQYLVCRLLLEKKKQTSAAR